MHWFFVQNPALEQSGNFVTLWRDYVNVCHLEHWRKNLILVKLNFTPILAERIVWWKLWKRINILSWLKRIPLLLQWSLLPVGMTSLNSSFQACPSFKVLYFFVFIDYNVNLPLIMFICRIIILSSCASRVWRVPPPHYAKARKKLEF